MTKLTYTQIVKKETEREVPDYYVYDDSPRGKVVDLLLKDQEHRGETVRDWLHRQDSIDVEDAIRRLEGAYEVTDAICTILGVTKS